MAVFAVVGVVSSIAYTFLYSYLRHHTTGHMANIVALLLSTLLNTMLNRPFTFGISGPGAIRAQAKGLAVLTSGLVTTTIALSLVHATSSSPTIGTEVATLSAANLSVTALRFVALRAWIFRRGTTGGTA